MFATAKEAKGAHWFSHRNQTSTAHESTHRAREERRDSKIQNVQKRDKDRAQRTPQDQIGQLDKRLGFGAGAKKERSKLEVLIAKNAK